MLSGRLEACMDFRILLTCVGGSFTPGTIKAIRELDFINPFIVGVDCSSDPAGSYFCDAFYQVPAGDSCEYFSQVLEIVKSQKIQFIIPASDEEALTLSQRREELPPETQLACTSHKTIELISNKIEAYKLLQSKGIPIPDYQAIENETDLESNINLALEKWNEIVIKPAVSRGARDIVIISPKQVIPENDRIVAFRKSYFSLAELKRIYSGKYPILVMEKFDGTVCDLDLLGDNGLPISIIPRRRIVGSRPDSGHIIFSDDSLISLGKKIIEVLNISWLYDCDFMFDSDGNPKILEINPRQSGSIAVTHAAGFPVIENLIRIALKLPISKSSKITKDKKVLPFIDFKEI